MTRRIFKYDLTAILVDQDPVDRCVRIAIPGPVDILSVGEQGYHIAMWALTGDQTPEDWHIYLRFTGEDIDAPGPVPVEAKYVGTVSVDGIVVHVFAKGATP